MPEAYVAAIRRGGGHPVALTWPDPEPPEEILTRFDGLLLLGGADIEPIRYGADPHPATYGTDSMRDSTELRLVRAAAELDVPTLAICRGIQVVNVALGGTLLQHLPDIEGMLDHGSPATGGEHSMHGVKVSSGSRLAEACGAESLEALSHHHQAVDSLGDGLQAVGWSEDGLVEAIELERGWIVGVQWHPEQTAAADRQQQKLFDGLVLQAMSRAA